MLDNVFARCNSNVLTTDGRDLLRRKNHPMTEITRSSGPSPEPDGLSQMRAAAIRYRDNLLKQVATYDGIIKNLDAAMAEQGDRGLRDLPSVTPREVAGMRTSKALEAYLKRRAGFKIPITRVVQDLLAGGLDPGKPHSKKDPSPEKNLDHKLKIVMRQNTKLVQWDENWTMWLAPTATEAPKPRKKYKPRATK